MNVKLRLFGFALVVVLLAALVGWAGQTAWRQLHRLRSNFGAVESEGFHLAEHVERSILKLNETVLRFDLRQHAEDKSRFHKESEELKQWLGTQKLSVTTSLELDLLRQIEVAFEAYVVRTIHLLEERDRAGSAPSPKEVLDKVESKAQLLALCRKLEAAERTALSRFVRDSDESLGGLQQLLVASAVLIAFLGFTATRLIYRAKIAPLRAQLLVSRAVIERQEKLASLGTLAAGVAHEIRNPLTAINVRLHSLKRTLIPSSSEHEDATVIDQEIQRLERIVRDFLQFARPSEPRLSTLSAESLFRRVQGLLGAQLEKASIRLNVEWPPAIWIRADFQQMEQVLINLVQNAAESIERSGTITLRARGTVTPLADRFTPSVILEVIDTGKGIPPVVQKRLFDPFFTTKESGSGLGLSIAARIVEKHGGTLVYETQVGRGTTFGIVLPGAEKDEDETET